MWGVFVGGHCGWNQVTPVVAHYCFFYSILDEGGQFRGISYGCVIPSLSVIIGLSSKAIGWG